MFDLAPLRTKFAIRSALLIGKKLLLADAVVTLLFVFVDFLFIPEALEDFLHAIFVQGVSGSGPAIVTNVEFLPKCAELGRHLIDELLRRNAGFRGGLLDLLPVLIDAGKKKNFLAFEP